VIEKIVTKLNNYKKRYKKKFDSLSSLSSEITHDLFDNSKKRIESEKIKIQLKKKYFDLGLYVAKQYLKHGYSDFTIDKNFMALNESIKNKILEYQQTKDSVDL
tara:strand:- start:2372 stop:2683 length:312 start_codon:yes stop_codon:yes gene_type:complete